MRRRNRIIGNVASGLTLGFAFSMIFSIDSWISGLQAFLSVGAASWVVYLWVRRLRDEEDGE